MRHTYFKGIMVTLVLFSGTLACAESNWKNAQEAYTKVCAYCHNIGVGPDSVKIVFDKESVGSRAESIIYTVRNGLNAMPAFRKTEIDDKTLKEMAEGLAKGEIK